MYIYTLYNSYITVISIFAKNRGNINVWNKMETERNKRKTSKRD